VDSSSSYGYSNADTLSTLANPPVNWNFTEDYTDSTKITIGFGTNGNPAGTVYAIRDSTNQKWISATGDTTSAATWRTSAQWTSTAKLINRNPSKKHILGVVARNGDGVQTAYTWGSLAIGNVRLAQLSAVQPYTHNGKSTVYSNQARTTNVDSIRTVAADTLGQRLSGSDYQTWRVSLQFVLPNFDTAIADTLQVTGAGDQSATDFTVMASKGLWASPDNVDTRYSHFSGYSSGVFSTTNWFNSWSTSSYGSTMNWIMNVTGLTWVTQARGDTLRMAVFSSRDSSATAPTGNEYLRVSNPTLRMSYVLTDKVPSNIVATSISPDSILVTWMDNSTTETGFALVNALTGLRMGANDSTAANVTFKRYGGLSPNTEYAVKVMALGGKLAGDISTSADSCYTKANTPGKPTASILGDNRLAFALDPNGNSAFTRFAVEDSVSGRYADATAEPETLRAGPLGEWGWRTYAGWGGAGGDTLAGIRPGDFYTIRAKARNGQ